MEEFYCLSSRCDLSLTEEQQISKYINGLKYSIQERVTIQDVFSIDKAQNKAIKTKSYRTEPYFQRRIGKDI